MNGMHDVGGMHGFGPVEHQEQEPVFHEPWQGRLLGVQIIGEGATELIHVGQMGLLAHCDVDTFVEHIFNFPTLAEGYRVAALHIAKQRPAGVEHYGACQTLTAAVHS